MTNIPSESLYELKVAHYLKVGGYEDTRFAIKIITKMVRNGFGGVQLFALLGAGMGGGRKRAVPSIA